jgi:protein-S-isoprenylcysteine O-methyltransferase Ste14
MRYIILVLLWSAWCFVHSALISPTVTGYLKHRLQDAFRYYRLIYNGFSLASLVPIAIYTYSVQTEPLFRWEAYLRLVQFLLVFISLFLFLSGSRHYDALQFLGIRELRQSNSCPVLTENCELDTTGVLSVIRHPWYAGGILLVWARNLDISAIITNVIITAYFIIGTFLEERKLSIQFGEAYEAYQNRTSMFFPVKWLKSKMKVNEVTHH